MYIKFIDIHMNYSNHKNKVT